VTEVSELRRKLESSDPEKQEEAVGSLYKTAVEKPKYVPLAVDELRQLLDDEYRSRDELRAMEKAADALVLLAREYPEDVRPAADELRQLLDYILPLRENAARALAEIAKEYPEDVRPAADKFRQLLDDENCRETAYQALVVLAKEYPEDAQLTAEKLHQHLDDENDKFGRMYAAGALAELAKEHPEDVLPAAEELRQLLDGKYTRRNAAWALANIAGEYPEEVQPAADELRNLATDKNESEEVKEKAELALERLSEGSDTDSDASVIEEKIPDSIPEGPTLSLTHRDMNEIDHIGRGGDADVFRVTVDGTETTLALKKPRLPDKPETGASKKRDPTVEIDVFERFMNEAKTWSKLDDHDHIVSVVDYGDTPVPWIAMEYMDGGELSTRMGEMDIKQTTWTSLSIVRGVRHAHRQGITHFDLKPGNILFREVEDGWDVPKVADWGLAKMLLEHSKNIEKLTPRYAAPEQFDPEEYDGQDERTDIYQLGAVFYEMFTDRPPFEGTESQVMYSVVNEEVQKPTDVNPNLPQRLDDILLKALEKNPDNRYETTVNLRNDLRELL